MAINYYGTGPISDRVGNGFLGNIVDSLQAGLANSTADITNCLGLHSTTKDLKTIVLLNKGTGNDGILSDLSYVVGSVLPYCLVVYLIYLAYKRFIKK